MPPSLNITIGSLSDTLALPLMGWDGGSSYYEQFPQAEALGWAEPTFFPISTFLSDTTNSETLAACGVNTFHGAYGIPDALEMAADAGMFVLPQPGDIFDLEYADTVGNVPGWLTADEPDLLMSRTAWQTIVDAHRAYDDGRFMAVNFGNMPLGPGYCPGCHAGWGDDPDGAVQYADVVGVDKYCYTSPYVRQLMTGYPPDWPRLSTWPGPDEEPDVAQTSCAYGWLIDQLRSFDDPGNRRPTFITVETKMPLIAEGPTGSPSVYEFATVITYDQIEGAVWSAIAHGAGGIMYFEHNGEYLDGLPVNDPNTGLAHCEGRLSISECEAGLRARLTTIHSQISDLAPVLNSQPYIFDFGAADIDTMLKAKDGYAYILASVGLGASLGSKTFTLTGSGITGTTVEVPYESRSISVTGGQFVDSFAAEYSHHIYKIAI